MRRVGAKSGLKFLHRRLNKRMICECYYCNDVVRNFAKSQKLARKCLHDLFRYFNLDFCDFWHFLTRGAIEPTLYEVLERVTHLAHVRYSNFLKCQMSNIGCSRFECLYHFYTKMGACDYTARLSAKAFLKASGKDVTHGISRVFTYMIVRYFLSHHLVPLKTLALLKYGKRVSFIRELRPELAFLSDDRLCYHNGLKTPTDICNHNYTE